MGKKEIEVPEGFPSRFHSFLKHFDLNASSLAKSIDDESGRVKFNRWLSGDYEPTLKPLERIASHYPVNLNWLLIGEGSMLRNESIGGGGGAGNGSPESKYQAAEFERLSRELEQERLNSRHKDELLKKEEKHNQSLALLLENFQPGATNDPSIDNDILLIRFLAVSNYGGNLGST